MQLYSKTLLTTDLDAIARAMGIECVHGSFLGERRRRVSFTLRPAGRDGWRMARDRRVNAVSWAGHYVFMRALFARDAHAEIRSSVARYVGASDFAETAFDTGNVNVGSQMSPLRYRDAEADGHVQWSTEADLVRIGDLLGAAAR